VLAVLTKESKKRREAATPSPTRDGPIRPPGEREGEILDRYLPNS
jgi:hypothetical protein